MHKEKTMTVKDGIVIAEAENGQVRIHAARSTEMVEEMRRAHDSAATCTAAVGRTLTVTALLASDLKHPKEHVRVRINGGGPIGVIRAEADGAGNVRGFADRMDLYAARSDGHLDVGRVVGRTGTLQVSRDMGLKEPFTGTVAMVSGEIGEDFTYYLAVSEQISSAVSVGVLVNTDSSCAAAGGMVIQMMPFASEEAISHVETIVAGMRPMSEYMQEGRTAEDVILGLFPDADILARKPLQWHCDCSRQTFAASIAALRSSDLQEMIREDHGAEAVCSYCHKKYWFSEADLNTILENRNCVENRNR